MSAVADVPDPYKILQVDPEAEDEVIQAAYRRLAQKYHPDLSIGQAAMDRMVAINAAWETIGDPKRRASYDSAQKAARSRRHESRAASGGSGASSAGGADTRGAAGAGARAPTREEKMRAMPTGAAATRPGPLDLGQPALIQRATNALPHRDLPSRGPLTTCRGTGRPAARRWAAATTRRRCAHRKALGQPGRHPGTRRARW